MTTAKPFPWFETIPTSAGKRAEWRKHHRSMRPGKDRTEILKRCKEDVLFYVNTFGVLFQALKDPKPIPFNTFSRQDEFFACMLAAAGKHDHLEVKSREQGGTWGPLWFADWNARFWPHRTMLVMSWKKELIDKTGDLDSLFGKFDFINEHLPPWFPGFGQARTRRLFHIDFPHTKSIIDGEKPVKLAGRGGRRFFVFLDETAHLPNDEEIIQSLARTTDSKIMVSTPDGMNNEFARIRFSGTCVFHELHWSDNPLHNPGLYTSEKLRGSETHQLKLLDADYWTTERKAEYAKKFKLDGKLRSPWYDTQEERIGDPIRTASELDLDFVGSATQFFPRELLRRLRDTAVRPPSVRAFFEYVPEEAEPRGIIHADQPNLNLWLVLDEQGNPPRDDYVIGNDISQGVGATPSVASIVKRNTGEKVGEYVRTDLLPPEFARAVAALAKWFRSDHSPAKVCWEANGPGRGFGVGLADVGFHNVYRGRRRLSSTTEAITGWHSTQGARANLLMDYRDALMSNNFVNPSRPAVDECELYIYESRDKIVNRLANVKHKNANRLSHGDRVIADAVAWMLCKASVVSSSKQPDRPAIIPPHCLYRRNLTLEKSNTEIEELWGNKVTAREALA